MSTIEHVGAPQLTEGVRSPADPWDLYRTALTIREVEQTLLRLHGEGAITGTVHTCIGQEACAAGVVSALDRDRDVIWSNHRGHGHYLAYCDDVDGLLAEVLGRETGVCRGIGGSQHLHRDNFYSNGILGGTAPCAVGSALAEKLGDTGAIVCLFLGDGALAQGAVHESLNMAALWELPLLVCVEANGYAQSTPTALEHAGDIGRRAESYGIASSRLAATDVAIVAAHAAEVVAHVRATTQPHFLVLDTYRLAPHSKGDDLRPEEEVEARRRVDPLRLLGRTLAATDARRADALHHEVTERIAGAVTRAQAAAPLDPAEFLAYAAKVTFLHSLRAGLTEAFARDDRALLLGEDVLDPYGGAFGVTKGLSDRFPGRVMTTPIAEGGIVGAGVGLALRGRRPIVEIMFGDFVTLAVDQLVNHAAKFRAMYGGQVSVPLVVRTPMGGRRGYGPTHSQSLEKLLLGVPGLRVLAPSVFHDPGAILRDAVLNGDTPTVLIEHKLLYPSSLVADDDPVLFHTAPATRTARASCATLTPEPPT